MREIDTEAPVIWPAWCYSGETGTEDSSPQTASSPLQSNTAPGVTTISLSSGGNATTGITPITSRGRMKRKTQSHAIALDKMLNNMMMTTVIGVDNAHKKLIIDNNNFYDKIKCENETNLTNNNNNSINNNNNSKNGDISNSNNNNNNNNNSNNNNNNNNIKSERLSPTNGEVHSSMSRSRSATPLSYPGTPPHPVDSINNQNSSTPIQQFRPEFQARNYSDFMRSLAAKYNNNNNSNSNNNSNNNKSNNTNDVASTRNPLYETKFVISPIKPTKESLSSPESKKNNSTSQIPNSSNNNNNNNNSNNNNLMSSLFSGLPFTSTMMPPLLDMSSTQALVTLARAAKDAEIQQMLRNASTQQATPATTENNNSRNQNVPNLGNLFPPIFPAAHFSLANFHQNINTLSPRSNGSGASGSNTAANTSNEHISSPLDLSSTPVNKKMKIELSSSSSRNGDLFTNDSITQQLQQQQQQQQHQSALQQHQQNEPVQRQTPTPTAIHTKRCQAQSEEINAWTIDQVCDFVGAIDICAEYVQKFREQSIDGTGLPLLTEEHLTHSLGMKLGPALKLRSLLVKKLGGPCPCASCTLTISNIPRPMSSEPGPGS